MASSQLHAPWDDGGYTSGDHETQHDDSDSFDSEDYDGNDPDYSDSEHNNSEESSEYDFCNNNFEDDSEYDLGYNNSENGSEYSHENDDEELIPRMQDIPDHGISSDVEDLVFEEEEEGIHDELEAEEYNDGSDTNALQPQMHNPFRPAYSFSNLQQEPKSIRVDRFGRRFESAVRFLVRKAQETDWSQRNTQEAWVHIGFKHPVGKSSPDMIMEIFRNVIPESTMAILGHTHVTYEHIMTLPTVDFSSNLPGVYLIAFAPSIHQQHQVHYGHFGNFTTPIGQQRQVPDTCCAGSSTVDISMRCHEHMQHFHDIDAAELHRRQSQPNRKSTMYLYKVAGTFGLVPTYLEIARFPEHLEEIGISGADANWLIRLLEQAMILLLDIYAPSEHKGARQLFGYTKEMYLEALAECEIPESTFHPLNHAMPLKQRSGWTVGPRVCRNCGNHTSAANVWYYDHADCELALFYICSTCYWYHRRHGVTRPSTLFNSFRARPSSGPCSNCNATETSLWSWHPNDRTSVVCGACLTHWNRYGVDRPPKKEEKHCTECGATDPIGHWHCVYDANREKTGASLCSACAMQQQRDYNKEAKANNYAGCICSICHGTNLPAWKTARTCLSCWENNRSVLALKRERDRSDCWHCHCPFQKQKFKATSNKAWRSERYWHAVLEEWICKRCSVHVKDHGSFGFTASDLEKFEIRCEDCHTLYAWRWCTLGQTSLDRIQDSNITWDRIMCGNCYQERNNNYFVNQQINVIHT